MLDPRSVYIFSTTAGTYNVEASDPHKAIEGMYQAHYEDLVARYLSECQEHDFTPRLDEFERLHKDKPPAIWTMKREPGRCIIVKDDTP